MNDLICPKIWFDKEYLELVGLRKRDKLRCLHVLRRITGSIRITLDVNLMDVSGTKFNELDRNSKERKRQTYLEIQMNLVEISVLITSSVKDLWVM